MIHHGDALTVLRTLPDVSVNCCITSPPYYGLRDYGTAKWEGGDPACDHIDPQGPVNAPSASSTLTTNNGRGPLPGDKYQSDRKAQYRDACRKCGARRIDQQIGLESTPVEYIARLVEVFREVWRVLKDDGTLWVNIGDSYAGMKIGNTNAGNSSGLRRDGRPEESRLRSCAIEASHMAAMKFTKRTPPGLKPKDLIGVPWMLAFALRDDGWYLRQDIIWCKGNCMPESVKDRCTKAHEYLFMLSKSARYWYDAAAISEPTQPGSIARYSRGRADDSKYADGGPGNQTIARTFDGMQPKQDGHGRRHAGFNEREFSGDPRERRNKRSWWLMNTAPTPEAHFATFPIELPETCLRAGCPEGGTVLDPFAGAGTTGLACLKNGRNFIGIELNAEYVELAQGRAHKYQPLFCEATL